MSAVQEPEVRSLLALLPPMRRARFWRLYAEDGRRFLDLWAEGGRGVLGSRGDALGRVMKENVDKGLTSPLPSIWSRRFEKALLAWKPDYVAARFFLSDERAAAAYAALGGSETPRENRLGTERPMGEYLERFAAKSSDGPTGGVPAAALVALPCPASWSCSVLLLRDAADVERTESDIVPPFMLAVGTRSMAEFTKFASLVGEEQWRKADKRIEGLFRRAGPWLLPLYPRERHADMFRACLEKGLVISPDYDQPSMLPGEFSDGELKPLADLR